MKKIKMQIQEVEQSAEKQQDPGDNEQTYEIQCKRSLILQPVAYVSYRQHPYFHVSVRQ